MLSFSAGAVPAMFTTENHMGLAVPYDPRAIANLLLEDAAARGLSMSNLKLQKLLFLCHAFYLVETGQALLRGSFEAWRYGPVHREAYDAFKRFADRPITEAGTKFDPVTGTRSPVNRPTDRNISDVVKKVVHFYGNKTPRELVELTHAKDGPWDYVVAAAANRANVGLKISDDIIVKRFKYLWFGRQPKLQDIEPNEDTPLVA
jgi:uncharacterized phage-associated protein